MATIWLRVRTRRRPPLKAGVAIRVPLLVRWPAVVNAGSVVNLPVSSPDFLPSLLDATETKPPPSQTIDGVSFLPLLRGETLPERALYWHNRTTTTPGASGWTPAARF